MSTATKPRREWHRRETMAQWHAMRARDLTSTDIPALFGLSPYKTMFELWHEKRSGMPEPIADNVRMLRGRQLEGAIAEMYAEERDRKVHELRDYARIPALRLGSSFDFFEEFDGGRRLIECKNVDYLAFQRGWSVDDDFIEAPAHIELQLQHQMLVSGYESGSIVALVGGNDLRIIDRDRDDTVHAEIMRRAAEFWRSIDANEPPDPTYPGDAAAVIRMCAHAEPGQVADLRSDPDAVTLFDQLAEAKERLKSAELTVDELKARMLLKIGDAEKAIFPRGTISAGTVAPTTYTVNRAGFRNFRLNIKKGA